MSEFEDKLNAILSNPDAMAQVASLAQSLDLNGAFGGSNHPAGGPNGGVSDSNVDAAPSPPPNSGTPAPVSGGIPGGLGGLAGLGDLLGNVDPKMIQRLLPLVGELAADNGGDERLALLYALRPFLKPERRDKVEQAVRAARLIHVGKKLLTTLGESHV